MDAALARGTFAGFRKGLGGKGWDDFFSYMDDNIELWFPMGKYKGKTVGKDKITAFFSYVVPNVYPQGMELELINETIGEDSAVFEFRDWGKMYNGNDYKNRVAISFGFRGGKLVSYREYFGGDGTFNE